MISMLPMLTPQWVLSQQAVKANLDLLTTAVNALTAQIAALDASAITTGTIAVARLPASVVAAPAVHPWTPVDLSSAALTLGLTGIPVYVALTPTVMFVTAYLTYPTTADAHSAVIGGLPATGRTTAWQVPAVASSLAGLSAYMAPGTSTLTFYVGNARQTNANLSGVFIVLTGLYTQ